MLPTNGAPRCSSYQRAAPAWSGTSNGVASVSRPSWSISVNDGSQGISSARAWIAAQTR